MEPGAAGQERNRFLRLLSLELLFADAQCAAALSDDKLLAAMARFEGALARACARQGSLPAAHADIIARVCERARFDAAALAHEGRAGTLAIPFVKQLTAQVASVSPEAARHVHAGATSQDVIDSAAVLCLKPACARIDELTLRLGNAAAELARRHADTPIAARTLLQPALPVTFGWKAAVWLSMLARSLAGTRTAAAGALLLQFGGPSGTLSSFGEQGPALAAALARELGLPASLIPWHSARDRFARLGAELAILAGAAGKIGRDVSLLMQPEVGEAAEGAKAGRGGSSSMPHKRNPALSMLALEAAQRAPGLAATLLSQLTPEHERGLGQWQSQWFTLRELACATASGTAAMGDALEGLEVNAPTMLANLESLLPGERKEFGSARPMIEAALAEWAATSRGTGP
ncbi:MAG TPA: lyase family protein [Burkholderiales bacterium]|nr:lyase family protein [Burkholderiales bacterium]